MLSDGTRIFYAKNLKKACKEEITKNNGCQKCIFYKNSGVPHCRIFNPPLYDLDPLIYAEEQRKEIVKRLKKEMPELYKEKGD